MKLMDCFYADSSCDRVSFDLKTKGPGIQLGLVQKHPDEQPYPVSGKKVRDKSKKDVKDIEEHKNIQVLKDKSVEMMDKYKSRTDNDRLSVSSRNDPTDRHRRVSSKNDRKDCVNGTKNEKLKDNKKSTDKIPSKSSKASRNKLQDDSKELATKFDTSDSFSSKEFECTKSKKHRDVSDRNENKSMNIADRHRINDSDHNSGLRMSLSNSIHKESSATTMDSESNHSDAADIQDYEYGIYLSSNEDKKDGKTNRNSDCLSISVSEQHPRRRLSMYLSSNEDKNDEKTTRKSDCRSISVSEQHPRRRLSLSKSNTKRVSKESCTSSTTKESDSDHPDSPNIEDYEYGVCDINENGNGKKMGRRSSIGDKTRRRRNSLSKAINSSETTVDSKDSNDSTIKTKLQRCDLESSQDSDAANSKQRLNRPRRRQSLKSVSTTGGESKESDDLKKLALLQTMTMLLSTENKETTNDDSKDPPRARRRQSLRASDIKQYIDENEMSDGRSSNRTTPYGFAISSSITMPLTDGLDVSIHTQKTERESADAMKVKAAFAA